MNLIHLGSHRKEYYHISMLKGDEEFTEHFHHSILDACAVWGQPMPDALEIFGAVGRMNPSYVIVEDRQLTPITVRQLAESTNVVIAGWACDIDEILIRYPSCYGILVQGPRRITDLIDYVGKKLVSIPLWLRDVPIYVRDSMFRLATSLEPYVEILLSSHAANCAYYGVVLDPILGERLTLPSFDLTGGGYSQLIYSYNTLCVEAWSKGFHPVSFEKFLKGEV